MWELWQDYHPQGVNDEIDKSKCEYTPKGACVLLNETIVSDSFFLLVDDKITATEACLKGWYAERDDVLHRVYDWKPPVRSCYTVYVPNDWHVACEDPEQQVYGKAPQEVCDAKGFKANSDCPCGWRTNVQNGSVIVTTPNLYLFRQSVAELLTGLSSGLLWKDSNMIKCMGF